MLSRSAERTAELKGSRWFDDDVVNDLRFREVMSAPQII